MCWGRVEDGVPWWCACIAAVQQQHGGSWSVRAAVLGSRANRGFVCKNRGASRVCAVRVGRVVRFSRLLLVLNWCVNLHLGNIPSQLN